MNCFGLSSDSRHYIQLKKITIAKCTSKRLTRKFENGGWVGVLDGGFIMKKEKGREKIFVSIYGWCYFHLVYKLKSFVKFNLSLFIKVIVSTEIVLYKIQMEMFVAGTRTIKKNVGPMMLKMPWMILVQTGCVAHVEVHHLFYNLI